MDEIYHLVGQLIHHFQIIEQYITLLVYKKTINLPLDDESKEEIYHIINDIYDKSFGHKLKKIQDLNILNTNTDEIVLEYIKNKRNYIAHNSFTEKSFNTYEGIKSHALELTQILHDTKIVETAIKLLICSND